MEATVSIPIALLLGWWADRHFETEPVFLLAGLGLGFATFVLRLVRMRAMVEEAGDAADAADGADGAGSEQGRDGRD